MGKIFCPMEIFGIKEEKTIFSNNTKDWDNFLYKQFDQYNIFK